MKKRISLLLLLAPIVLFVALCFSEAFFVEVLKEPAEHYERKVGQKLLERGVVACWDFDEPRIVERVWLEPVLTEGTRLVEGRHGKARRFLPAENGYVSTAIGLARLGTDFTIVFWLRVPDPTYSQRIFRYARIENGQLEFEPPAEDSIVRCDIPAGRWVHVAGVMDSRGREVRLYVDGELRAAKHDRAGRVRHELVTIGQVPGSNPPDFVLDELVFWNKALSEDEVAALADSGEGVVGALASGARRKARILSALCRTAHNIVMLGDTFNPFYHESAAMSADIPHWNLVLSRKDEEVFAEFESVRVRHGINGYCTSDRRTVDVSRDGRRARARMEMFCPGTGLEAEGKSFAVNPGADDDLELSGRAIFEPPALHPFMPELLAVRLARELGEDVDSPRLCSVTMNGRFHGVYLARTVGDGLDHYAPSGHYGWREHLRVLPFLPDKILEEFDGMTDEVLPILLADRRGALSSIEWRHLIAEQRCEVVESLEERRRPEGGRLEMVRNYLAAQKLIGGNPAPEYIVGDLDLSLDALCGVRLGFSSRTPGVLSDDGRITRPSGVATNARLAVTFAQGTACLTNVLEFTVIPECAGLPLLRVNTHRNINAARRVGCTMELVEEGGVRTTGLFHGRIRWRGNTSLVKADKKYFSIRMDHARRLLGIRETRYLKLTSGWRDPTMLRDKVSYDLFRDFASPGNPRYAPDCRLIELVIDDRYHGVYTVSDRVDGKMLGFTEKDGQGERPAVLYKAGRGYSRGKPYVQKFPDKMSGECWGPYREYSALLNSDAAEFAAKAEQMLDIGNIIDFEILINFTSNAEGGIHWPYMARGSGPDSRFFFVPWDFDMTFRRGRWNMNALQRRLRSDLPGYRERLSARYAELRGGVLSEDALMKRIAGLESYLADAMRRNRRCWDLPERKEFHANVEEMRGIIRERLALMDRKLLPDD